MAIAKTAHMTAMWREMNAFVSEYRLSLRFLPNSNILNNYYVLQACRDNKNKGEKDITSQKEQKLNVQPSKDNRDKAKVDKEVENPQTTPASADFLECYATAHG